MKELNAGMVLSETYIKASTTNRTNVLKRRQENTLDFMRTYGILLPLQKLQELKKPENCFSCTTVGLAPNYTDPQSQSRFLQTSHLYGFSSNIATEETHIIQEISGANRKQSAKPHKDKWLDSSSQSERQGRSHTGNYKGPSPAGSRPQQSGAKAKLFVSVSSSSSVHGVEG